MFSATRKPPPLPPQSTPPKRAPLRPSVLEKKIAYAVTVTEDGNFIDGAAVLAFSIMSSHERSKYAAELVAFVSPRVGEPSRRALATLGFASIEKGLPINVTRIKGKRLRKLWSEDSTKGGCCGAWELLKLYSWTLTEYYRVVHVDMDCMLLHPIDELFDIDAPLVYTADYNMMNDKHRQKGIEPAVQGGFLVVKPNLDTFLRLAATEQKGDWDGGWAKTAIGTWWGGSTIQGLLPYYFAKLSPNESAVEVDRCIYDNMGDKAVVDPLPRVGASACRMTNVDQIKFVHFTVCQKPWTCHPSRVKEDTQRICVALHKIWFGMRAKVEAALEIPLVENPCKKGRYRPIDLESSSRPLLPLRLF